MIDGVVRGRVELSLGAGPAMARSGNQNPLPANRFREGQSGNPGGMTAALRRQVAQNAARAVALRGRLLEAPERQVAAGGEAAALAAIGKDVPTLLRGAEHHGLGASVQLQEHEGGIRVVVRQPGSDQV